jgi:hypothetical protein
VRKAREEDLAGGKITQNEYDAIESLERAHIANFSLAHTSIGYLLAACIGLAVLIPLAGNPFGNRLVIAICTICRSTFTFSLRYG